MRRFLSSVVVVAVVAVAVVAACGSGRSPTPPTPTQAGVYSEDLDRSVDPCTDFYEFSNGAWRKANPIPASMTRWSRRWQAGETSKDRLKDILVEVSAKHDWKPGSVEQLIGDYYGACMDEVAANAAGAKPLEPVLAQIAAIEDRAGLQRVIAVLQHQQITVPFSYYAQSDLHEPTDVIGDLGAAGLTLPDRDYYLKTEPHFVAVREAYMAYIAKLFQLIGRDEATAKAAAQTVSTFETRLAMASLDNVAKRDPKAQDHKMTREQLQQLAPSYDWKLFVGDVKTVNVDQPEFVKAIDRELAKTPVSEWKTYLEWQYISSLTDGLSQPFVDATFDLFGKVLGGTTEPKPRWKRCVEQTDQLLGEAVGQKYVEKYFPPAAKARMTELVHNLLGAMKDTIEGLDWMTPPTKQKALEKLATFNPKIGYPDKWKDYSTIAIRRDTYFADMVAARTWNGDDDLNQIGKPVDRGRWGITPSTSDAYYNASLNEIVFPAGILQPPAFRIEASDAINYGAIGVVIGHEISHGFDDQGAQFDAQGRLENWWTQDDLEAFTKRGECVVSQFDHYFVEPNLHHNGKLVLGESIGDSGGANLAYRALEKTHPTGTIDGFTPEQQFFIAWGQFRSDAIRIEQQRQMIQGDPHPIAKYRVIGPLSNMPEFAAAFSCKPDAAMVRAADQRCKVW